MSGAEFLGAALRDLDLSERQAEIAPWVVVAHLVSADPAIAIEVRTDSDVVRLAVDVTPGASLVDLARGLRPHDGEVQLVIRQHAGTWRAEGGELDAALLDDLHRRVVHAVAADPAGPIDALDLVAPDEPWTEVRGPEFPYDREATLWSWLARQAEATPHAVAVRSRDGDLTYAALAARARGVAQQLRADGVRRGDRVGVAAVRTLALPVALYGILAAGAAWVPLEPSLPVARLREMAEQAGVSRVLGLPLAPMGLPVLDALSVPPADDLSGIEAAGPDDLCYVIFTSGSTGRPKGVMVAHASVVNRLAWMQRAYPMHAGSVILQKTPAVFDVSVWELFWWSAVGASMALLPPGQEMFPAAISAAVERFGATHVHFIPSLLHLFAEHVARSDERAPLSTLVRVFSSGEALSAGTVRLFGEALPTVGLTNLYGPTEATVDATAWDCPTADPPPRIPIGRPIDNLRAYVLREGRPCPPGVVGRLHLGGVGVARGYVGAPELTARVFLAEPGHPEQRMYDTGDLARWTTAGELEFLGRRDLQIKIAGMRVELEEIEAVARTHGEVSECAVVARRPSPNLLFLRAFVVPAVDALALRTFLRAHLPKHMVPSEIVFLERLPRTPTGKIDRQALASLALDAPEGA